MAVLLEGLPELPDLLERFCDAAGVPRKGRVKALVTLLEEAGCDVGSPGRAYWWFRRPGWMRPADSVRPYLARVLKLSEEQELLLLRVIARGPMASNQLEASP